MRWTLLAALGVHLGSHGAEAAAAAAATTPTVCNGHAELCDRRYSNVTFVGAHDSAFVGASVADNQDVSVAAQLAGGVRFLQAQTHAGGANNTVVELCHTFCVLEDAGALDAYLTTVRQFLDANPAEVVTLLLTNQDGLPGAAFDAVFQSSGARSHVFTPPGNLTMASWPTLGQMIAMGQRLVVFMGAFGGTASRSGGSEVGCDDWLTWVYFPDFPAGPPVPYILNEFQSFML